MDELSQQAQQAALDAYNEATTFYNDSARKLDEFRSGPPRPSDDAGGKQWDETYANKQRDFENARSQLAQASKSYSDLTARLATAYEANQRAAKDPNEQAMWANEAQKARAQTDLYTAESAMYQAKTDADIQNATARAQAALSRAQTYSQNSASLSGLRDSQKALSDAKLAFLPALSQSTIALHNQQIATAQSHASLYAAQTARANAQADYLIPAQVDELVQRGVLDQARADQIKQLGPVKIDDLQAKIGLNQAKVDQIRAVLQKWNVLPATDRSSPTLVEQQPFTGEVRGVPNPGYVNPETQAISDTYSAIDYVQNQLANGQITSDDANSLIDNLKSSLSARAKGFTPEQLFQNEQDKQRLALQANQQEFNQGLSGANFGRSILSGIQSSGDTMAGQLLGAAGRARGLGGMSFSPYANALDMAGGDDAVKMAQQLMAQVKPVTDRLSALDAVSKYGAAKALLDSSGQSPSAPSSDQGAPQTPAPASDQTPAPSLPTPFAQSDIPEGTSRRPPPDSDQARLLSAAGVS